MPYKLTLPDNLPVAVGRMSRTQINAELNKGLESLQSGIRYSVDETDNEFAQEFGI